MTTAECPHCGNLSPADAWFCTRCGRAQRPVTPPPLDWRPGMSRATTPLIPSAPPAPPVTPAAVRPPSSLQFDPRCVIMPVIALLFAAVFIVCLAEFLHNGGIAPVGLWPTGVLALGALLAQAAWVKGQIWRGLRGMGLWGGMTWLLATGHLLPWTLVLIGAWLALLPLSMRGVRQSNAQAHVRVPHSVSRSQH